MTVSEPEQTLAGQAVFLSASIPDPARWSGEFDALEITDAVVAIGRAILSAGARLITAAHPTIAPLLLYIASELPPADEPRVIVYQSAVFDSIMPEDTRRFAAERVGTLITTERVGDEPPDPALAPESLSLMRRQMLTDTEPTAAVFIGGMAGIPDEMRLFNEIRPGQPTYPIGNPGGEARNLSHDREGEIAALLLAGTIYPTIGRLIVDDIAHQAN
ncbi:MAG: hypothetical protein R2689_05810 [Microthrixaceae bacterium]|nr:hypothetical protein [Microthrixaceae bacterium]